MALVLVPRQLFAVPLFSWVNELGLSDSLLGVMLPGVVTGLGVIYLHRFFDKCRRIFAGGACLWCGGAAGVLDVATVGLAGTAQLRDDPFHPRLAEHLFPMLVLTSETKQTLPLARAKLYDVSQRTPQGVQMAAQPSR
ncbi:MAG: hypothetical protein CM1200mP29_07120 [Verrucomicrobiota bacterium]|nr:MAG: hypothetical protein CM1200mP29_07120 [Verrucomicrobiota bacterium]